MEGRTRMNAGPGRVALCIAVLLLLIGLNCAVDVAASWASWGPRVVVTVTVTGAGGTHSDDGMGTYQDVNGVRHTVALRGASVSAGQRVPVTLSPIPWDRSTVYNGAGGPVGSGEVFAAVVCLLLGGAIIVARIRRRRRDRAPAGR